MKPTRRQLVRMLATTVPLAGASQKVMGSAAAAREQTAQPSPRASSVSERLRNLRLDDAIEPAVRFRPRL